MARYREIVCRYYVALGQCKKGKEASHKHICQTCAKYEPRAKVHLVNKKKAALDKIKRNERE